MSAAVHKQCLICSHTESKSVMLKNNADLVKCTSCGFVYFKQIPSGEELENYYKGYGRNDYLSPITIKRYNEILDKLEPYRKTGKLLDVGCGIGYFLEEAKKRGWQVHGTEYTDKAIEICESKGIQMKKGVLNINNYTAGEFDVITSFEVIEHINNPLDEIQKFNTLLRSGGVVYITTPNFNSLQRLQLGEKSTVITYPEHLSYYTPSTLSFLFSKLGFKPLDVQTTGISITRIKIATGKSKQQFISKESDDEKLRVKMEENKLMGLVKAIANFVLSTLGCGDSLKGYYIKK